MKLLYTVKALKNLEKFPKDISSRIMEKMDWLVQQDNPLSFAKTLKNSKLGKYRFRIGDYRVFVDIFHEQVTVLIVLAIRPRQQAYT